MTPADRIADARTFLFVPGHRPTLFDKALRSGADALVLDLEDGVPAGEKAAARDAIGAAWERLNAGGVPLVVRINATGIDHAEHDLAWLGGLPRPAGFMVPKAESADALRLLRETLPGVALLPLVESAAGYLALPSLAAAPGVSRLVIGNLDFAVDIGLQCDEAETELAPLRFAVAVATRVAGLAPAVDGVTVQIDDEARLRDDVRRALRFGFGGKLCIHPRQVAVVHEALAPTTEELEWARRVIAADAAAQGGPVQVDGRMVDRPVVLRAQRVLARAKELAQRR